MRRSPDTCLSCERRTVPYLTWRDADETMRTIYREAGMVRYMGRGLCGRCYKAAQAAGTLADYDTTGVPGEVLVDEWQHLVRHGESMASECRRLAPRLGTTPAALERALNRAGVTSTWNGDSMGRNARDDKGRFAAKAAA